MDKKKSSTIIRCEVDMKSRFRKKEKERRELPGSEIVRKNYRKWVIEIGDYDVMGETEIGAGCQIRLSQALVNGGGELGRSQARQWRVV